MLGEALLRPFDVERTMSELRGRIIEFRAPGEHVPGGTVNGYLSLPASGAGPGLLVLQEWWGLVEHIKQVADRFAAAGYVVLAPDLYQGESTTSPDDARRLMMSLELPFAAEALGGAADFLHAHDAVHPKRVGALGFCMGGQLALYAATVHPEMIDAVVDFYGVFTPGVPIEFRALKAPVLAHFGVHDSAIPRAKAERLMRDIAHAGGECDGYFYEAGHAFFNDSRPTAYDAAAAALAWNRTIEFLHTTLATH
jgi:carboxymethylenebutenolidase